MKYANDHLYYSFSKSLCKVVPNSGEFVWIKNASQYVNGFSVDGSIIHVPVEAQWNNLTAEANEEFKISSLKIGASTLPVPFKLNSGHVLKQDNNLVVTLSKDGKVVWRRFESFYKITGALLFRLPDEVEAKNIRFAKSSLTTDHFGRDKIILVLSKNGILVALRSLDGKPIWKKNLSFLPIISLDSSDKKFHATLTVLKTTRNISLHLNYLNGEIEKAHVLEKATKEKHEIFKETNLLKRVDEKGHVAWSKVSSDSSLFNIFEDRIAHLYKEEDFFIIYIIERQRGKELFSLYIQNVQPASQMICGPASVVIFYYNKQEFRNEVLVIDFVKNDYLHQIYIMKDSVESSLAVISPRKITRTAYLALTSSKNVILIPDNILSAKRKAESTDYYPKYTPIIEVSNRDVLSYYLSVSGIKTFLVDPTFLESTSSILGFGNSLFYAEGTPSGTFDMLKHNFNYFYLSFILVSLLLSIPIVESIAEKRRLAMAWK